MEELYQDLTPDQEGVSLLPESPESKAVVEEEGFNVNLLGTVMEEDEEEESGSLGLGISPLQSLSFLNAPILASSSLSALPQRPPMLRRAVSMKVRFWAFSWRYIFCEVMLRFPGAQPNWPS